jgi:hypothetical protein
LADVGILASACHFHLPNATSNLVDYELWRRIAGSWMITRGAIVKAGEAPKGVKTEEGIES